MPQRRFGRLLAALAALRLLPALVALAARGHGLPGIPGFRYGPPQGDTYGFYAAAREFISALGRVPRPLAALVAVLVVGAAYAAYRLWRGGRRAAAVGTAATACALVADVAILRMGSTGAGAAGWPIVWSVPMLPLRVAGVLGYHGAFYLGLVVVLAANAATVVATGLAARHVLRSASLGLVAAALLVVWPFLLRAVEGTGNLQYGAWLDDSGLSLYSEPLSTALVAGGLALLLVRPRSAAAAAGAGALLGYAASVRLSNALIAALGLLVVAAARDRRLLVAYLWPAAAFASIAVAFWSRGYADSFASATSLPAGLFSWSYVARSWRDSAVFEPRMLALLLPVAVLGLAALRRSPRAALLLGGVVAVTALFYSGYYITALHPRFLYVALPALFVLEAAGIGALLTVVRLPARLEPLGGAYRSETGIRRP